MSNVTIIERPSHLRYNKLTDTYTVVRGSSYVKRNSTKKVIA